MILKGENRSPRSKAFPSTTLTTTILRGLAGNAAKAYMVRIGDARLWHGLKPEIHASNISDFSAYLTFFTMSLSLCNRETTAMYC